MSKTKIEWADFTINPVKGLCPMACSYCYARAMYKRFKWNPTIEWDESCLESISKIKKPSRIFVGSTMELFGDWVGFNAINYIINYVKDYPQHTFIFLTKQPAVMSQYIFPDNCWVGVSATDYKMFAFALQYLSDIKAAIRFISLEPLLDRMNIPLLDEVFINCKINWLIIGQQTPVKAATTPKIEWVKEIIGAADIAGVPVFLKNNLESLLLDYADDRSLVVSYEHGESEFDGLALNLRQELPLVISGGK